MNIRLAIAGALTLSFAGALAETQDAGTDGSSWRMTTDLAEALMTDTATLLPSGKVLVAGGNLPTAMGGSNGAIVYDPGTEVWKPTGLMGTEEYGLVSHTATLLRTGKVLVAGGRSVLVPQSGAELSRAELYDPSTDSWNATGSMTTRRFQHTATLLLNGQVLVAGGYRGLTTHN
jgi:N-acetylneuraminic acid mutarotase